MKASGVVMCSGCSSGSDDDVGEVLMIERSMCALAAWMYSSCVSGRETIMSPVKRIQYHVGASSGVGARL